jgi:hypothetical protein
VAVHDLQLVHDLQHLRGQALLDQLPHVGGDGFVQAVLVHQRVVHAGRGGAGEAGAAAVRGLQVDNRVVRSANALYRADVMTEGAHQDSLYERVLEAQLAATTLQALTSEAAPSALAPSASDAPNRPESDWCNVC